MASTSASKPKKAQPSKAQPSAEDSSAFGQIAERFRRAGDLERAVSLCREGLQKRPDHISARVTLGWALLELGKFDDARVELEQVLRRRPDNLAAIRALAELHDRAEHTLNLPMDGPGQWPPSADQVDEMAGSMVADHFRAVSADDALESGADDVGAIAGSLPNQPAVVPPAELGLAMWSALPATEPAEPAHLSISPASIAAEPEVIPEVIPEVAAAAIAEIIPEVIGEPASTVLDAEIAALLAEAESLDALAEVEAPVAPAAPQAVARVKTLSDIAFEAFETEPEIEPTLELESEEELEVLTAFETSIAQAPVVEELTAGPVEVATVTLAEPGFELEGVSVTAVETAPTVLSAEDEPEMTPGVLHGDTQPILRFDLEPVAEPAALAASPSVVAATETIEAVGRVETVQAFEIEPEPVAAVATVPTEQIVESAVISSVQARIAEVVAMARRTEPVPVSPKPSVVALERLLGQVQARRRLMAESVA